VLSPQNEFIWLTLPENAGIIPKQNAASEATYHHINLSTKFGRNAIHALTVTAPEKQTYADNSVMTDLRILLGFKVKRY
jgi:uncharacterized membrane protein YdfJ with MMPL/SSD domain